MHLAWSPDGVTLPSGSSDGSISLWDGLFEEKPRILIGHTSSANFLEPDSYLLALRFIGGHSPTIRPKFFVYAIEPWMTDLSGGSSR